ncbi:uncharacterized protein LOC131619708 [Vicia villosa]|uniref:uncharacterized protein LOC131619708 n=1 Tax=Vicia villosa TaxID=3911 RepID=UPI00273AE041|nr:uncharacterized protein LOC131619708 [Vicia villosa]
MLEWLEWKRRRGDKFVKDRKTKKETSQSVKEKSLISYWFVMKLWRERESSKYSRKFQRSGYSLDAKKAKGNNNLVAGTCDVNNHPLFVLVDCGAMYSFISNLCVLRLGFEAQKVCKKCSITFNSHNFLIDLIYLSLKKIDVILDMDWLSNNSVYIGCKEKAIFIPAKETTSIDVIGNLIKGTVKLVNYLFAQEKSFLLVLTTDLEDRKSVSEIPIVFKFPYVFPEDVISLPLEREVKISIDLVLGTALVSIAPYWMSPAELIELKSQLE